MGAAPHPADGGAGGEPARARDDPPAPDPAQPPPLDAAARARDAAGGDTTAAASRAIARRDFEQVIRRAAELSLSEKDAADEQLSEEEVLRIATELGLPAHHVQQALFELPELTVRPRWYDRYFGPAVFSVTRVVPAEADLALRRVEDYLVTREYLQIVRRRGHSVGFVPADDTLSSLARALSRPGRRHIISRASRVVLGVHEMPGESAHVRFDVDLSDARSEAVRNAIGGGTVIGLGVGGLAAMVSAAIMPEMLSNLPHLVAFTGGLAGTVAVSVSAAASRFKERVFSAKHELTGLLDRLERGDRLDPPPAPWRRRLQLRLFGDRGR